MDEEKLRIEYLPVNALKPYERNARAHGKEDVGEIKKSIKKYGFDDPIAVWSDQNIIVEGHGRLMAAKQLGMKEVPVIRLDHLSDAERREYALLHNKTAELSAWDFDTLAMELSELDLSEFDIDWNLPNLDASEEEAVEDDYDEPLPEEPTSKLGDIYQLGRHRLMCGDSTNADMVKALMGGEMADMLLTDPPYGVDYEGGTGMKIENDKLKGEEFLHFLADAFDAANQVMKPGAVFYIWHADSNGSIFRNACDMVGWTVRQCLIWVKNALVMGRQDYQWRHEPCQPAGTIVWTPNGERPIEELKDGDRVISFDTYSGCVKGYKDGYAIKTASRQYDGILYGIRANGKQTWATDNHEFSVRFNPETAETWSTYLMVNENGWWRVGVTRTYDARGFGLKHRFDQEHATAAWIISTFGSQADAQMGEQLLACKYGIPYTHWNIERGQKNEYNNRTEKQISWLYGNLDLSEMQKRAEMLLANHGRSIKYPLVSADTKADRFSRRVTAKINACNIIPGLMLIPIPKAQYEGDRTFDWAEIETVDHREHHGLVYSLAVDKYHHYIADGIVTHNCLYGWKEGASHLWASDRKQTTVLEFDKPKKNDIHPTMKPVPLFDYQMKNNTKGGDIVLDLFGGSGTTIIAAEQNGRRGFVMEYDPRYVDAIIGRYEAFTGDTVELLNREEDEEET